MVATRYVPDTGHIVWLTFSPQAGREQAGRRPALVLSPQSYNETTSLALFCPITSRVKGYPFEVALPPTGKVTGVILADHIRNLDWRARRARFEGHAPPRAVTEVREKLAVLQNQGLSSHATTNTGEIHELLEALSAFVTMFELVFDHDWDTTRAILDNPEHYIESDGTFIRPEVHDEDNNWANRSSLLAAYRKLRTCMEHCEVPRDTLR